MRLFMETDPHVLTDLDIGGRLVKCQHAFHNPYRAALRVVLQSRSELVHAERSGPGWSLSFRHVELNEAFQVRTDAVVLGSGYRHAFPPCMDRLAGAIEVDGDGQIAEVSERIFAALSGVADAR